MKVQSTTIFKKWLADLTDHAAQARILGPIRRLKNGNLGVWRSVGSGILEMKMDFGPGYRVYLIQRADVLTILLCGGDKRSQSRDIELAKGIATRIEEERLWTL